MKKNMYALALGLISVVAFAKTLEVNEIQVLLSNTADNMNAPWFSFSANTGVVDPVTGSSITNDPTAALPAGSNFVQTGLILRAGTVDLSQENYLVDANGNPITELNSIGSFTTSGTMLSEFDPSNPPMVGTVLDQPQNIFSFNGNSNTTNQLFTLGSTTLINNNPMDGGLISRNLSGIIGGTGKNQSANGGVVSELHVAPDGLSSIMVVRFDRKIKINVPNRDM